MGTQTPKAAGSNPSTLRATEHAYAVRPAVGKKRAASVSSWHGPLPSREASERHHGQETRRREQYAVRSPSHSPPPTPDIPEQLAELLITMMPGPEGEELAEAYREAADFPPITCQSLSELDIQNIIRNIRLRHDINFDSDLSFRPNLDGAKGQEKVKTAHRYWRALVAELELYNRLFRGTPPLQEMDTNDWPTIVRHAERRIPKIFQTIRDVLKSLVPERDHVRVKEHLDDVMLMRQIERGICDLVGLSEWMSCLLKEHCAPMRDEWVDKMVAYTRTGVTQNKPDSIVKGLCELLGILESMKLDVANHQIRNLKTLLIEDTINFETHYHLDRLVNNRTRIHIPSAQKWYAAACQQHANQPTTSRDRPLEIFVRALAAPLFTDASFPETTYLDAERLAQLKADLAAHASLETCLTMFTTLASGPGKPSTNLCTPLTNLAHALTAIMSSDAETDSTTTSTWHSSTPALALEILRHAAPLTTPPLRLTAETTSRASTHLTHLFATTHATHLYTLQATLLPLILATVEKHALSSPAQLFSALAKPVAGGPAAAANTTAAAAAAVETLRPGEKGLLCPDPEKMTGFANRLAHVAVLNWRTWRRIAYVDDGDDGDVDVAVVKSAQASKEGGGLYVKGCWVS